MKIFTDGNTPVLDYVKCIRHYFPDLRNTNTVEIKDLFAFNNLTEKDVRTIFSEGSIPDEVDRKLMSGALKK